MTWRNGWRCFEVKAVVQEKWTAESILKHFEALTPDPSWSFAGLTQRQTNYATHGYHRYPAKFIPQLVARLLSDFSAEGDLVVDPFMGSGTTLVEAKLNRRPSVGVDINPVAHLVAKAKVTPIEPSRLESAIALLEKSLSNQEQPALFILRERADSDFCGQRLDYWFPSDVKSELMRIHAAIENLPDEDLRVFFRCAFSHILKPCSWWLNRSVKPTRDLKKRIPPPILTFFQHVRRMASGNRQFWELLRQKDALDVPAKPYCADARQLPLPDSSAQLIVTSPPYVTSYEYADLHQLTVLWYQAVTDLKEFRRQFIGTASCNGKPVNMGSFIAETIVAALKGRDKKKAQEVAVYFTEMRECFLEMWRVLKRGGYACIVIGNTRLCGVEILNAQVFVEQMLSLGFELHQVILREIPSKILPRTRDQKTGKFAKVTEADFIAYPHEFILVLRKL
jgi:DNA modification methylase